MWHVERALPVQQHPIAIFGQCFLAQLLDAAEGDLKIFSFQPRSDCLRRAGEHTFHASVLFGVFAMGRPSPIVVQ